MALTEKQKKFVDYYFETGNGAEAARRAGYKEKNADKTAYENLRKPEIMQYMEERRKQMDEKRIATVDDVLLFFTRVMNGEEKDQFGLDASLSDRLNAGKELMKRFKDVGARQDDDGVTIINDAPN